MNEQTFRAPSGRTVTLRVDHVLGSSPAELRLLDRIVAETRRMVIQLDREEMDRKFGEYLDALAGDGGGDGRACK